MDESRDDNTEKNKSVRERQISCDFTHLWHLRNKTNKQREKIREGDKSRNRLLMIENKLMVTRGKEVGGLVK